jgi:hypothetical protein
MNGRKKCTPVLGATVRNATRRVVRSLQSGCLELTQLERREPCESGGGVPITRSENESPPGLTIESEQKHEMKRRK